MADRVIIVGVRRAKAVLPASELRQMTGRAGRKHDGSTAHVDVIVDPEDVELPEQLLAGGSAVVKSTMSDPDLLAGALIPEVFRGIVTDRQTARGWCARSLFSAMGGKPPVDGAIELLLEVEAMEEKGDRFLMKPVGECSAKFYFHPADVYSWKQNFDTLFELGLEGDDVAPAWAIGNVPFGRVVGDLGTRRELSSMCKSKLPLGLSVMDGSLINVVVWWSVMGGPGVGPLRPAVLERRHDFGRFQSALKWLFRDRNESSYFNELHERVSFGVTANLVGICQKAHIGKGKATALYNMGVRATDDPDTVTRRANELSDEDYQSYEEGP